jgi:hypothetical protein
MTTNRYAAMRRHAVAIAGLVSIVIVTDIGFAAAQSAKYDGTYAGLQTLSEDGSVANYSKCLRGPFKRRLVVKGDAVTYEYNPTYHGDVTGTVNADGDVSAGASTTSGGVSLSGKIQGDDFTGEVWSLYCTYSLRLKRAP